ncbi:MAG: phosphatidate cytidylyltransferase [Actinomycetota bacterium]|nr:phosphatidate cytidylyltransferase [Actinomycetota bacterium]
MYAIKDRVLTALSGAPILLIFLFWGRLPFAALCSMVIILCVGEIAIIYGSRIKKWHRYSGLIAAALYPLAAIFYGYRGLLTILYAHVLTFIILLMIYRNLRSPEIMYTALINTYVSFFLSHLILLRASSATIALAVLLATWAFDIFAYFIGSNFGAIRVVPKISPNKTLEGMLGGLGAAVMVLLVLTPLPLSPLRRAAIGFLVAVSAQAGDLIESKLKRFLKVKDSGTLLPGHGGFLDRFDSLILAAPAVFYLITLSGWMAK